MWQFSMKSGVENLDQEYFTPGLSEFHKNPIAYKTARYHKYPIKRSLDCILKPTWNLRVSSEVILYR